jgi:DNA repair protein RecO (recombination protein O)
MLSKTKGIVIKTIKYGESSAICNILTEDFGLIGFHIPSAYKPKSKYNISYFQALNVLEISFNFKKNASLYKLSDISCIHSPRIDGFNKQVMYHLYCEILQDSIKSDEINANLFNYLMQEAIPELNEDLHFWQLPYVMLNLLYQYGCAPNTGSYQEGHYLDLENGLFVERQLELKKTVDSQTSNLIYEILQNGIHHLELNRKYRAEVIHALIKYFKIHINENFDLKSMEILSEVSQ